jgi:hypothetical protein
MKERLVYLIIILALVIFNVYIISWHSAHYDYLNQALVIIQKNCEKNGIKIPPVCNKNKCLYNGF